jgi:predicted transcriptional regulator
MARRSSIHPTESELTILGVLWNRGASTVREVHEELGGDARTGYTTTLKLMQIMVDKGLVRRDESKRTHVYGPAVARVRTQQKLVKDMVDRAFEGSVGKLVLNALSTGDVSPEELAEIRRLLEDNIKEVDNGRPEDQSV